MAEWLMHWPSKSDTRVRFPVPAQFFEGIAMKEKQCPKCLKITMHGTIRVDADNEVWFYDFCDNPDCDYIDEVKKPL